MVQMLGCMFSETLYTHTKQICQRVNINYVTQKNNLIKILTMTQNKMK